jgi:hypothetical protein
MPDVLQALPHLAADADRERHPLVFLHAVTGPVAVRRLLP